NDRRADVHLTGDLSSFDAAARPVDDAVFRIAVLGDFSGRAHRSAPAPASAQRIRRVDRDDLDDAIAAFAPRIEIALESGQPSIVVTAFRLDDFHPDRLIERVSMLRDLRAMREQGASSPPSSSREPPRRAEPKTDAVVRELSGGS